jgi:hypothetical protein
MSLYTGWKKKATAAGKKFRTWALEKNNPD